MQYALPERFTQTTNDSEYSTYNQLKIFPLNVAQLAFGFTYIKPPASVQFQRKIYTRQSKQSGEVYLFALTYRSRDKEQCLIFRASISTKQSGCLDFELGFVQLWKTNHSPVNVQSTTCRYERVGSTLNCRGLSYQLLRIAFVLQLI